MSQHNRVLGAEGLLPMRASVLRNLASLFNAMCHVTGGSLDAYPEVRRSVLNYGLATLAGRAAAGRNTRELERQMRRAILYFEPRLLPDSVRVSALGGDKDGGPVMAFRIDAQLVVQGGAVGLTVNTRLDRDIDAWVMMEAPVARPA